MNARETRHSGRTDYLNLVTVTARDGGGALSVAGTALGAPHRPRLVAAYGRGIDLEMSSHMVIVRAAAAPGVFGCIGTKLGEFGRNIAQLSASRPEAGDLDLLAFSLDEALTCDQLEELVTGCGLESAQRIEL